MHMSFWWDLTITNFLFTGYNITTVGGLISTCFGLAALAIFLEWLKLLQVRQQQKELFLRANQIRTSCPPTESAALLFDSRQVIEPIKFTLSHRILYFLWDAFLWLNFQVLGYILMLAVMVYNGWMVISLILGSGIGYFIFGPSFMKVNMQNCQVIRDTFCASNYQQTEQDSETTPALQPYNLHYTQPSTSTASNCHESNQKTVCDVHEEPEDT